MNNELSELTGWPDLKGLRSDANFIRRDKFESGHLVSELSILFIAQQHISQLTLKAPEGKRLPITQIFCNGLTRPGPALN